jgi:hypothetical protein
VCRTRADVDHASSSSKRRLEVSSVLPLPSSSVEVEALAVAIRRGDRPRADAITRSMGRPVVRFELIEDVAATAA